MGRSNGKYFEKPISENVFITKLLKIVERHTAFIVHSNFYAVSFHTGATSSSSSLLPEVNYSSVVVQLIYVIRLH